MTTAQDTDTQPVIETHDLTREFAILTKAGDEHRRHRRTVHAVRDLNLIVRPGEAVGYVGANGAGKSTTIKMLTGILNPTAGTVRVMGLDPVPRRRDLARRIGVVFGQRSQLWWDLPLKDSYRLLAAMHRLSPVAARARLDDLTSQLGLSDYWDRPVRQLSLGQRMRGEVAAALLHSPGLVILDEPTIGLDMISKEALRSFLDRERRENGTTLLLTTHDLSDVERLCGRIVIVNHGAIAYDGSLTRFRETTTAPRYLTVDLKDPCRALELPTGATTETIEADGLRHRIRFDATALTAAELLTAISGQAEVSDLSLQEPAIEDLVRQVYRS